jgi:hypothetical protein
MNEVETKQDDILSVIGLKRLMVWKSTINSIYDENKFKCYVSSEYRNSKRKEMDEFYRISEITLLHKDTGLRMGYVTSESYDGETVEYKLRGIFIITSQGEHCNVLDVDFNKKIFFTSINQIAFSKVNRLIE